MTDDHTRNREPNYWQKIPKSPKGATVPNITFRMNPSFKQAIEEMAKRETERCGVYISKSTVLINLTTRNTLMMGKKRSELIKRYKELRKLNREKRNVQPNQTDKQNQSIS